jgi:hypothetical protein
MDEERPLKIIQMGCEILDPVMNPHGFSVTPGSFGESCGGYFARRDYIRGDRRLDLHFRHSLGLVAYHIGDASVSHDSYLRELTKGVGGNQYPGFSTDPLDEFRHLAHDLQKFCGDFLFGDGEVLLIAARNQKAKEEIASKIQMAGAVGDERARLTARELFREKKYHQVLERLGSLQYPELMTNSEKKMLEIAKRNAK